MELHETFAGGSGKETLTLCSLNFNLKEQQQKELHNSFCDCQRPKKEYSDWIAEEREREKPVPSDIS